MYTQFHLFQQDGTPQYGCADEQCQRPTSNVQRTQHSNLDDDEEGMLIQIEILTVTSQALHQNKEIEPHQNINILRRVQCKEEGRKIYHSNKTTEERIQSGSAKGSHGYNRISL